MRNYAVEEDVVDAVLTASRPLVAVTTHSGVSAEEITIGQYRCWWCWRRGARSGWWIWLPHSPSCLPQPGGYATG